MSATPSDVSRWTLNRRAVFLSASIPDPSRWEGAYDAIEVTDAVVAAARAILTRGGLLVSAAHPTIAPLLMYVAAELPASDVTQVIVYQSDLFDDVLPEPTRRFGEDNIGDLRWTPAVEGEAPEPGKWDRSLRLMRHRMLSETDPAAAIFVGGMGGISDEFSMFREVFPDRPVYPVGRPGGEARVLANRTELRVPRQLDGDVYPALFRRIVADIVESLTN
jgi:hypothetical protein